MAQQGTKKSVSDPALISGGSIADLAFKQNIAVETPPQDIDERTGAANVRGVVDVETTLSGGSSGKDRIVSTGRFDALRETK
jgi:hypothetical protein